MKTLLFLASVLVGLAQAPLPSINSNGGSGGGGSPGGANTQIQFNDSSAFGGNAKFTVNKSTGAFTLNKLGCTGTAPFTCTFYDDTASTGLTKVVVKAGAGQTTGNNLQEWQLNAGTVLLEVTNGANLQAVTSGAGKAQFGQGGLAYSSDSEAKWFSGTDINGAGSYDLGLCRGAAGQVNVNDGSATCANLAALAAASMKTGSTPPAVTVGTGGVPFSCVEGTAPSVGATAGVDIVYCDSTLHQPLISVNNGPFIPTVATTTITTGTSASLATPFTVNQEATAGTGVAYTLPTAASGLQFCIDNGWNGSAADTGVLTLNTSASGQFMVFTDGTLTATGGNVTSAGAARDGACVYGIDSTHWMFLPHSGTWSKH